MSITNDLAQDWHQSGIEIGDMVLIHSNIKRTLIRCWEKDRKVTPATILESFIEAVGPEGTLLFPLFNFDFTKGIAFDYCHTKSQMGALTEVARHYPNAVRTGHPIYSFAVLGKLAPLFADVNNYSGYGDNSPFAILHQTKGKIAALDLPDQDCMTFYHYVEEMHNVAYRYHKHFTAGYTDKHGQFAEKTYGLFVRDTVKGVKTYLSPIEADLWQAKLYNGSKPGQGSGLRTIKAVDMYDFASLIINEGKAEGKLYKLDGED